MNEETSHFFQIIYYIELISINEIRHRWNSCYKSLNFYDWTYFSFFSSILWYLQFNGAWAFRSWDLSARSMADTSCVTGLPARSKHRSCRIFLSSTSHAKNFETRDRVVLEWPIVALRAQPLAGFRCWEVCDRTQKKTAVFCQVPNHRNPQQDKEIALAHELSSNPYN